MKFIVDQQLPPALAKWLAVRGHDAEHVRDIGLHSADDMEIGDRALRVGAAIITKDEDFAARRIRAADGPTVVWLRIGNVATPNLFAWLDVAWEDVEQGINAGSPVVEVR